ncbi:GTPase [Fistulifera solaris]|uniref:GTPase n=1 Tax=Fistulifera solaris TaxID=1519565 RepID=A0A1Z5KNS0_FISSO|nr:GTPase [Fistulifera solaris]|eukprot:GAX27929.1 GTPase [Fistulifera solaris]
MTWIAVWSALVFCTANVQAFSLSNTRRTNALFVSTSPSTQIPSPVDDEEWSLETAASGMGFYDLDDNTFDFNSSPDFIDTIRDEADILEEREDRLYIDEFGVKRKVERCILVGVEELSAARRSQSNDEQPYFSLEESMTEMRELIKTAGMEIAGEVTQRLNEINPRTYIGTGKVEEANELMKGAGDCSTIVFDAELTPRQQKHLENSFNKKILQDDFLVAGGEIKVIDRTALILDIFAQHAKTKEGKLQVELALHEYRKPRLTKMWTHLERQSGAGGVGLRGPGESQLEIDKRLVRDRIITLKHKIDDVQKHRTMHRLSRKRTGLPFLSLVGYTNAGKSSLLNYLTRAGVMAESILFATLDPTTRKVKLPGYKTHPEVLLTDTVGFIQKLPTHLVAAFRATLEEVKEADVLIHVIDVSNPSWEKQELAVLSVLKEMNVDDKPIVRVLNKMDLLEPDDAEYLKYDAATSENTVAVSAKTGEGLQDFVAVVEDAMSQLLVPIEILLPYSKGDELNIVHEQGNVEVVDYRETGTYCRAMVPTAVAKRLEPYSASHISMEPSGDRKVNGIDDDEIDWAALAKGRH